jgi:beta-mannanase
MVEEWYCAEHYGVCEHWKFQELRAEKAEAALAAAEADTWKCGQSFCTYRKAPSPKAADAIKRIAELETALAALQKGYRAMKDNCADAIAALAGAERCITAGCTCAACTYLRERRRS